MFHTLDEVSKTLVDVCLSGVYIRDSQVVMDVMKPRTAGVLYHVKELEDDEVPIVDANYVVKVPAYTCDFSGVTYKCREIWVVI